MSDGLVLSHGAGSNANAPLLVKVAEAFTAQGMTVLRINLAFRQKRPNGPPPPGSKAADQASIREAAETLRAAGCERVFIGGHSYGGRMSSMLAAEHPETADGLLLLSYPLHAPTKSKLRDEHFPALRVPALFVSGDRDTFGSPEELRASIAKIPGQAELSVVAGAGHDLKGGKFSVLEPVLVPFRRIFATPATL